MRRPHTPEEIVGIFLDAYRQGAFPMPELPGGGEDIPAGGDLPTAKSIHWYRPDPRAVLPLTDGSLRVPRSIQRSITRGAFTLTSDQDFEGVIRACARPGPSRGGAWLDESLVRVYTLLHHEGHAHSIEAWRSITGILPVAGARQPLPLQQASPVPHAPEDSHPPHGQDARGTPTLLGGIYGVSIGAAFFAESMFSDIEQGGSGASSACLVALWHHLRACGYTLLDVQIANEHTLRFGVQEIPLDEYLVQLVAAASAPNAWRAPA